MKTVINIPSELDFLSCKRLIIEESPFRINVPRIESEIIHYVDLELPFRHVLDYSNHTVKIDVWDEKQIEALKKIHGDIPFESEFNGSIAPIYAGPNSQEQSVKCIPGSIPVRTIVLETTFVQYTMGQTRIIMTPFDEFKQEYNNWLKKVRLDIND